MCNIPCYLLICRDIEQRRAAVERSHKDAALNAPLEQRLKQLSSSSGAQHSASPPPSKSSAAAIPSLEELEARLRAFQGESTTSASATSPTCSTCQPPYAAATKPLPLLPPKKPEGVAVDELLSQVMDEVSIEQMTDSREMRQIEERLAALRRPPDAALNTQLPVLPPLDSPPPANSTTSAAMPTAATASSPSQPADDLNVRFEALERDIERTLADVSASRNRSPAERLHLEQLLWQLKLLRQNANSSPSSGGCTNPPPSH